MNMQNQKITIELIETKEFHVAARGYNQHEVDEFLDSICDELERIEAEMDALRAENDRLQNQALPQAAPVVSYAAPVQTGASDTFQEILEMAQRVKEQTIADAEAKAADIINNAEIQVKARLGNLAVEKDEVEAQVKALKAAAQDYKAKFAEMIANAQEALDAASDL